MSKRFLSMIVILSFGLFLTTEAFALSGQPKTSRTTKRQKKVRGFSSTTQPHADGLLLERRRKRTPKSLLPYMEQSNLKKKPIQGTGRKIGSIRRKRS